jgi:hypothetical protein
MKATLAGAGDDRMIPSRDCTASCYQNEMGDDPNIFREALLFLLGMGMRTLRDHRTFLNESWKLLR